jgi:hypothetical protein
MRKLRLALFALVLGVIATPAFAAAPGGPVAVPKASPATVLAGCAGWPDGRVTFDHADSYHQDAARSIVRYAWDFDDRDGRSFDFATTDPNMRPVFMYGLPGTYSALLRVIDDASPPATDQAEVPVEVLPPPQRAPHAVANGPFFIQPGEGIVLDARGSSDPNLPCGDTLTYEWDVNDDFVTDFTGPLVPLAWSQLQALSPPLDFPAHPLTGRPTNWIRLTVRDSTGLTRPGTTSLTVFDPQPVAVARARPQTVPIDPATGTATVALDGTGSFSGLPGGRIAGYAWDFDGDGVFDATGATVSHAYGGVSGGQTATARLRVTDDAGRTDEEPITLTFDTPPSPPFADPGGPYYVEYGNGVTLDGTGSYDPDAGDAITRVQWRLNVFSDCVYELTGAPAPLTLTLSADQLRACMPALPGSLRTVSLTVYDGSGESDRREATLLFYDDRPDAVASADPMSVGCDVPVTFSAAGSRHGSPFRTIVAYEWDFDFIASLPFTADAVGPTVAHTFLRRGEHSSLLRVTDDADPPQTDVAWIDTTVDFTQLDPVARPGGPYIAGITDAGTKLPLTLDARASADPNEPCDEIRSYEWDTDGDGIFGWQDLDGANAVVGGVPLVASDLVGPLVAGYVRSDWVEGQTYPVALRVRDLYYDAQTGIGQAVAETTLRVRSDPAPSAEAGGPYSVAAGDPVDLLATVSDPEGDVVHYEWIYAGPGSYALLGSGVVDTPDDGSVVTVATRLAGAWTAAHGPGTLTFGLSVDDGFGQVWDSAQLVVGPPAGPDTVAPVTTASVSPTANANGWHRGAVTVTLTATDDRSGVAGTEVDLDGAGWVPYAAPSVLEADGVHLLRYRSTDGAANVEAAKELVVRIDRIPPEAVVELDPVTKELVVRGRDSGSGVGGDVLEPALVTPGVWAAGDPVVAELRTYLLADAAGNGLGFELLVRESKRMVKARLVAVAGAAPAANALAFEWRQTEDGTLQELEQRASVDLPLQSTQATYAHAAGETVVRIDEPRPRQKLVLPGLRLLRLLVSRDGLVVMPPA